MSYLVFDIGGTKTRLAVSDDGKTLSATKSIATKNDFKKALSEFETVALELLKGKKIKGVAGSIRGVLNEHKTGIDNDAILTGYVGKPITESLAAIFNVPVSLENDAALAGLGEAVFGAGQGMEIVAYHTVSTGVGGVKIENGAIDLARVGFEPGHQVLDIDRTILGADITPTLENLVSGAGVEARMGVKPYEIPQSDAIWDELAEYLGQGLRNTILYWSPEMIVLGGSMIIGDPKIPLEAIRKYTVAALDGFVECPFITTAKLGDEAGLYGALAHIHTRPH